MVVKAQVLVGGRGKAGGIKVAQTPDEAEEKADAILGMDIKGLTVRKVLVDQAADIRDEIYLGLTIDRAERRVVMMAQRGRRRHRRGGRQHAGEDHQDRRRSRSSASALTRRGDWRSSWASLPS